jgi:divalent metal cation (Fe/Co/Zn/Cd) transporter
MPEHLFHQRWEALVALVVAAGILATCGYAFFENWIG